MENDYNNNNFNQNNEPQQPDYNQQYNQYNQNDRFNGQPYNQNGNQYGNQYGQYPNYQPQQYQQYNQYYPQQNENGQKFAVASLILGILSLFCCGLFSAIPGLIFGIISKKRQPQNNGVAIAGIVLAVIGICIWIVCIAATVATGSLYDLIYYNYYF